MDTLNIPGIWRISVDSDHKTISYGNRRCAHFDMGHVDVTVPDSHLLRWVFDYGLPTPGDKFVTTEGTFYWTPGAYGAA